MGKEREIGNGLERGKNRAKKRRIFELSPLSIKQLHDIFLTICCWGKVRYFMLG